MSGIESSAQIHEFLVERFCSCCGLLKLHLIPCLTHSSYSVFVNSMGTFADELTEIISQKRKEGRDREKIVEKWQQHEDRLLGIAVEKYKDRCIKEATSGKCSATISFELITREIPNFPKHMVKDGQYFVDDWGDGCAEWWFYASRGTKVAYSSGTPILYAEVLESMMSQFLEYAKTLGFESVHREPGTWKVTASWNVPGSDGSKDVDEPPAKRAKSKSAVAPRHSSPAHTKTPTPTDQGESEDDDLCNALDLELKKGNKL
jgi:hypothetical protein